MPTLIFTLHSGLAKSILIFTTVLGLWALWLAWRKQPLGPSYWGAIVIGEFLFVAQAVLGFIMILSGTNVGQWVHILYGVFAVTVWPATYGFIYQRNIRDLDARGQALVFGLIGLFLAGIALRGMLTAH